MACNIPSHCYERQVFICEGRQHLFWCWNDMPEEERLAAVEKELCAS